MENDRSSRVPVYAGHINSGKPVSRVREKVSNGFTGWDDLQGLSGGGGGVLGKPLDFRSSLKPENRGSNRVPVYAGDIKSAKPLLRLWVSIRIRNDTF